MKTARTRLLLLSMSLLALSWGAASAAPSLAASSAPVPAPVGGFERSTYTPAVLRVSFTGASTTQAATPEANRQGFLDITLIPPQGEIVGKRVQISRTAVASLLQALYRQLARQESLDVSNPRSASRQLYDVLIRPVEAELRARGISTILISADAGLQGVPYAALHDGSTYFGLRYALSLTPSIGLLPRVDPSATKPKRMLALGASEFSNLAPLPLVPQELNQVTGSGTTEKYLNRSFTPQVLLERAGDADVTMVHVATHAEFLPGGVSQSKLYSGTEPMSLERFSSLRQRRKGSPLKLFSLSACRTALGDPNSELGFAGLALQAGAESALGTLWYVDDVATSAFFIQLYRFLDAGLPKSEALQATRAAFMNGQVRLIDNQLIGVDGNPLLSNLGVDGQRDWLQRGLQHPYYWAGIQLLGTPW